MLDSGKVDEQQFLNAIGGFFQRAGRLDRREGIERATLGVLPSRFVFQHHILPIEIKENAVVLATYDLFNSDRSPARLSTSRQTRPNGSLCRARKFCAR